MGREPCSITIVLLSVVNYNWPHVLVLLLTVLVKETLGSFTIVSGLSIFICEMGLSMGPIRECHVGIHWNDPCKCPMPGICWVKWELEVKTRMTPTQWGLARFMCPPIKCEREKAGLYWVGGVLFHRHCCKLLTFQATDCSEAGRKALSQVFCFQHG